MSGSRGSAASALVLALMLGAPVWGQEPVREDAPWLRRWFPELRQEIEALPPLFSDTKLNLHLRTFYLNRTSTSPSNASSSDADQTNSPETVAEALATGEYQSGWLLDAFSVEGRR
jgi:hypothetical protein